MELSPSLALLGNVPNPTHERPLIALSSFVKVVMFS
jgi:hypothetical protein